MYHHFIKETILSKLLSLKLHYSCIQLALSAFPEFSSRRHDTDCRIVMGFGCFFSTMCAVIVNDSTSALHVPLTTVNCGTVEVDG